MSTLPDLRPATPEEIGESLSYALRYDGRKRVHHADELMAKITAERLVRHLDCCGLMLIKHPDAATPRTGKPDREAAAP